MSFDPDKCAVVFKGRKKKKRAFDYDRDKAILDILYAPDVDSFLIEEEGDETDIIIRTTNKATKREE